MSFAGTDALPLTNSWPLWERERQFEHGWTFDGRSRASGRNGDRGGLISPAVGLWQCDLPGNRLTWSAEVYDIFGFPRDARLDRDQAVACYCEHSRAKMERLRAYAIRHRRGFTLDAEIVAADDCRRWIRLIAAPVCDDHRVVRLHGIKLVV